MKVERLKMDQEKARELWRKYQAHLAGQTKADQEILRRWFWAALMLTLLYLPVALAAALERTWLIR
jgi:hypothetical protein